MDEEGWVMYHGCGPVLRVVGACGGLGLAGRRRLWEAGTGSRRVRGGRSGRGLGEGLGMEAMAHGTRAGGLQTFVPDPTLGSRL